MSFYQGKKVLITGASAGIGYALAEELAQLGAEVIITARRRDRLDELASKIESLGVKAHVFVEDLSLPESGTKLYDQIKSAGLSVDILVNNRTGVINNVVLKFMKSTWNQPGIVFFS